MKSTEIYVEHSEKSAVGTEIKPLDVVYIFKRWQL